MFGLSKAWLYTAISGLLVALGVFLRMDAKKDARRDDREADYVKANEIDDRVSGARRVHDDDIKFRD